MDEKACLWKVKLLEFKIFEITLLSNPAFNFEDSLGAIILAEKVFEKIIALDSFAWLAKAIEEFLLSLFVIFEYENIFETPYSPSFNNSLSSIFPKETAIVSVFKSFANWFA